MSDHRGEENIIAVHLADAIFPAPHMLHVFRQNGESRDTVVAQVIRGVIKSQEMASDASIHRSMYISEIVSHLTYDVGYVIDVTYKNLPQESDAWFVKFTAYRTDNGEADLARCRGGLLVRVEDKELKFYGETGIFCGMSELFPLAKKYRVYSPPTAQLPEVVWVYFHESTGRWHSLRDSRGA